MLKNSSILSLFGLGLILSTSPLFALMDSSIDEIPLAGFSDEEEELGEIEEEEEETVEEVEETEDDQETLDDLVDTEETVEGVQTDDQAQEQIASSPVEVIQSEPLPSVSTVTEETITKVSFPLDSSVKTTSQGKGTTKARRKYVKDYRSRKKTKSEGVFLVDFDEGKQKYLYSIDKDIDFSFSSEEWRRYQKISEENIKISLFKNTAWASKTASRDEYEELSYDKVKKLFNLTEGKEKAKLKQLLVSLSNRREWSFHENFTTYNSELVGAETDKDNKLDLKLKYFLNYEELKDYVVPRVKECVEKRIKCVAVRKNLVIIDQDKKSFFKENKKLEG